MFPFAERLDQYSGDLALEAAAAAEAETISVHVRAKTPQQLAAGRSTQTSTTAPSLEFLSQLAKLRRRIFLLENCAVSIESRNEVYRLARAAERRAKQKLPPDPATSRRLCQLNLFVQNLETTVTSVVDLEDECLLDFYRGQDVATVDSQELFAELQQRSRGLLMEAYTLTLDDAESDKVTLVIFGERPDWLRQLSLAYLVLAKQNEFRVRFSVLRSASGNLDQTLPSNEFWVGEPKQRSKKQPIQQDKIDHAVLIGRTLASERALASSVDGTAVGVAIAMTGALAMPLLESETGLHVLILDGNTQKCLIDVSSDSLATYKPPRDVDRRGAMSGHAVRRTFQRDKLLIDDMLLKRQLHWATKSIDERLCSLVEERLLREAENLIDESDS